MLTKLEIINDMLAATGTAPVSSATTQHPSYIKARNKLDKVSRVMQGQGYWFNKSVRTLKPNTAGEVILPSTALHVDATDRTLKYAMRGNRLYDMKLGTYDIGVEAKVVFVEYVEVPDLPPTAQSYLQAQAVYAYFLDEDGKDPKLSEYRNHASLQSVMLRREELRNQDVNFFDSPSWKQHARPGSVRRLPLTDWN
jgi:hypothetical protein